MHTTLRHMMKRLPAPLSDGTIHNAVSELLRIPIPRSPLNKPPSGAASSVGHQAGAWWSPLPTQCVHSRALQAKCPDSAVECVGDVENTRIVLEEQAPGLVERHFGRRPLLAVEHPLARAGHGRDLAVSIDLADPAVMVAGDE